MKTFTRLLLAAAITLLATACASTRAFRHKNGSLTISERGSGARPGSYWITGAAPGRLTLAEDLTVFRKGALEIADKVQDAVPVKCAGFVDLTETRHIEVRLVEIQGGGRGQAWANGRHKLIDENAPKPFYHWLIP